MREHERNMLNINEDLATSNIVLYKWASVANWFATEETTLTT